MRILVIGDSCEDIFVRGKVDRLCPEAPVPVLNPKETVSNPGMAANVVANLRSLRPDAEVFFLTQESKIKKTRFVDEASGYILLRVDSNDKISEPLSYRKLDSFLIDHSMHHKYFDLVIFSDYNKGFLTESVIAQIVNVFYDYKVLTFLDTKKVLDTWSNKISFIKINAKEYELQLRYHQKPEAFCSNDMIVTLGKDGSKSIREDMVVASEPVKVMDVSGAGDTYMAAFAVKYAETRDKYVAMKYANKAASIAVSNHGVVAVKQSEVEQTTNA